MNTDYDALIQERVDELLLIEQRSQRRADQFLELNKRYQEKHQLTYEQLSNKAGEIYSSLQKINEASEKVAEYVGLCKKQATRSTAVLLYALVTAAFIISGTIWWSHYVNANLADAKAELSSLNTKLSHTPVIAHFQGNDYIRIVPDSETGFTRGDGSDAPGRYAEVKYAK